MRATVLRAEVQKGLLDLLGRHVIRHRHARIDTMLRSWWYPERHFRQWMRMWMRMRMWMWMWMWT